MDDYPVAVATEATPRTFGDRLKLWITSDCRNRECIEGNMHTDDGEHVTLWNCPICNRSAVPSAATYTGSIEYWTDKEMAARIKDRKDVYYDREYRYRRGMEIMALLKSLTHQPVD